MNGWFYPYAPAAFLEVSGEDAAEFLQSQFSNDLRQLAPGTSAYGLWLDRKAHVTADSFVMPADHERFFIVSYYCEGKRIKEKLESFIIADDVEVEEVSEEPAGLALGGPDREAMLDLLSLPGLPERTAGSGGQVVFAGRRGMEPVTEVIFSEATQRDAVSDLLKSRGAAVKTMEDIEGERLSAMIPRVPVDLGEEDYPHEGGLVPTAVSLSKGCFLGQEVVARLWNTGRWPREARLLRLPSSAKAGTLLFAQGKGVGEIRSSLADRRGFLAYALIKRKTIDSNESIQMGDADGPVVQIVNQ